MWLIVTSHHTGDQHNGGKLQQPATMLLLLVPVLQILGYYQLCSQFTMRGFLVRSWLFPGLFLCQHPVTPRPSSRLVTSHQAAPLSSPRKCEMRAPAPRHRYGGGGGAGRGGRVYINIITPSVMVLGLAALVTPGRDHRAD